MHNLHDRLATSLSGTYTLERELGGGGMSRVFVAEETALGRKVVVKVLSPEMAEGVSAERFVREIKVAARLQQANIVPVLRAGELDGLPYYTMPFVAGESLRSRMQLGALSTVDALAILRDVAKALAYAHAEGVVHRDVKPENVLLSAGTAVVTDFGIAKAISAARKEHTGDTERLTSVGTSLGTPAYMAPEQAAGDPSTDARADLYAWGVMAYELLAGRHPFARHTTMHALIRANMAEVPEHLGVRAPDAPIAVINLVMRCLAKSPDERPASAAELVVALEGRNATSGANPSAAHRPLGFAKAVGIYGAAFVVVVLAAKFSITLIGVPTWVFIASIGMMVLGLPVVLLTAIIERQHRTHAMTTPASMSTMTRIAVRNKKRFTWRRLSVGGVAAVGVFAALVVAYMAMRQLGIGPFGSLIGSKALAEKDRILIADLRGPAADTSLGAVLAEGLRAALSESKAVRLVTPARASAVLMQMQKPGSAIVGDVAQELAERSGAKAILDGDVRSVGKSYTLTVRLFTLNGSEPLVTLQETAKDDPDFTPATGRLAKRLRERIGESLKSVNSALRLEDVTTGSLPAWRKYTEGRRAEVHGAYFDAIALYQAAAAIDSGFAKAYAAAGSVIGGFTGLRQMQSENLQKAFDARSRARPAERLEIELAYWSNGPTIDLQKYAAALEALTAIDSGRALGFGVMIARLHGDFAHASRIDHTIIDADSIGGYYNLAIDHAALGQLDSVRDDIKRMRAVSPAHPLTLVAASHLAVMTGDDSSALAMAHAAEKIPIAPIPEWGEAIEWGVLERSGKFKDARRAHFLQNESRKAQGETGGMRGALLWEAVTIARTIGDSAHAVALLDSAIAQSPWETSAPRDRDYSNYVQAAAAAHRPDLARRGLDLMRRDDPGGPTIFISGQGVSVLDAIVLRSEGKYDLAIAGLQRANREALIVPTYYQALLSQAFDAAGQKDSARVHYEKYVNSNSLDLSLWVDSQFGVPIRKRLGELYEERGEFDKAYTMYASVVNQWKHADPEVQPVVATLRARMARLESRRAR